MKAARDKKLCKAIGSRKVTDWVGQVTKVGANSDGKGILEVELAKGIIIKTWNNSLSDMGDHTLIEPGSAVFNTASNFLKVKSSSSPAPFCAVSKMNA